jgi:glycosyltransferase involved in cell wall biosynthesis
MKLAVLMMVKDEAKDIEITLKSLVGQIETLIVYDTGSTDGTLDVISKFCESGRIKLYQKSGKFVNFAVSRNESLDFADTIEDVDYIILMDCKDRLVLRGNQDFSRASAWAVQYELRMGGKAVTTIKVHRVLKNRSGMRYYGVVHEYLALRGPTGVCETLLIQDRDGEGRRLERDYALLLKDHLENPGDSRTLYYLAQTCHESKRYREAIKYSLMRLELEGFHEEIFGCYMRCAKCFQALKMDPSPWYLRAYGRSERAEPLEGLVHANSDISVKQMFIEKMCQLQYPKDVFLSVDEDLYSTRRWELARKYDTKVPSRNHQECLQT